MRRPGIFPPPGPPGPPGRPGDVNRMLSWRPGAVTSYYEYLRSNLLFDYKARFPAAQIIVRFQHPQRWWQDLEGSAVQFGQQIAATWHEIRPLDPYVCFANELNLHFENGDTDPKNQPRYETAQFYERIGWWVTRTAQIIKEAVPDMRLITPPFAAGRHEDGAPNDQGQITEAFAGYDYLTDAVRTYFDNTLAVHAYWGDINGSHQDRLRDPQVASWHAFRWRRLLKLFAARYNIQARIILDEAGNYATYDPDFLDQIVYFSQQTLADPRVLALTFYLWDDPSFSPGNIFNVWSQYILDLPAFTQQLANMPDITNGGPSAANLPANGATLPATTNNTTFDGQSIRVLFDDGHVETVALEEYLRAVVPAEMPASWHTEAVKAQAIASRTYALNSIRRGRFRDQGADIAASFSQSQQFDRSRIHPLSDAAILATKGLVITHNGQLIDAVFSANCGGRTLNNEDSGSFGRTPLPYLRGVDCPNKEEKFGHGVGMCQHGAQALAKQGLTFSQILAHYYSGVRLEQLPQTTVPSSRRWTVTINRTSGFSIIVGNLFDRADVEISATLPNGQQLNTRSGTKPEYGAGGFEIPAQIIGNYTLEFLGQRFALQMDNQTGARLNFTTGNAQLAPQHGAIAGTLTDKDGNRLAGQAAQLQSGDNIQTVLTDKNGLYRFENLAAGVYRLLFAGSIKVETFTLDGQSFHPFDAQLIPMTESGGWTMRVEYGPALPLIVGDIGQPNQQIRVTAPNGAQKVFTSGTKQEYGPGGFEISVGLQGYYTIQFANRRFSFPYQGQLARLHFQQAATLPLPPTPEELVRLTSRDLSRSQAESLLVELGTDPQIGALFSIEDT